MIAGPRFVPDQRLTARPICNSPIEGGGVWHEFWASNLGSTLRLQKIGSICVIDHTDPFSGFAFLENIGGVSDDG